MALDCMPLLKPAYHFSTNADSVFGSLLGGLCSGECVEVAGEAGCGKSFLAATLCIQAALGVGTSPGVARPNIYYIKLEDASVVSLTPIVKALQERDLLGGLSANDILDRIRVIRRVNVLTAQSAGRREVAELQITSPELLLTLIQQLVDHGPDAMGAAPAVQSAVQEDAAAGTTASAMYAASGAPTLYVFDTLAAVLRAGDMDKDDKGQREPESSMYAGQLSFRIGSALQKLAVTRNAVVVVVNQAADSMTEDGLLSGQLALPGSCCPRLLSAVSEGKWVRPALGSAWEYGIKTKVLLVNPRGQKASDSYATSAAASASTSHSEGALPGSARLAYVLSSNRVSPKAVVYTVGPLGVRTVGAARDIIK